MIFPDKKKYTTHIVLSFLLIKKNISIFYFLFFFLSLKQAAPFMQVYLRKS